MVQRASTQQGYMCALSPPRFSMFPIMRCLRCRRLSNFKLKKKVTLYLYRRTYTWGGGFSFRAARSKALRVSHTLCARSKRPRAGCCSLRLLLLTKAHVSLLSRGSRIDIHLAHFQFPHLCVIQPSLGPNDRTSGMQRAHRQALVQLARQGHDAAGLFLGLTVIVSSSVHDVLVAALLRTTRCVCAMRAPALPALLGAARR